MFRCWNGLDQPYWFKWNHLPRSIPEPVLGRSNIVVRSEQSVASCFGTTDTCAAQGGVHASHLLYLAVFISGFIAIGYEVIWFRLVSVLLKGFNLYLHHYAEHLSCRDCIRQPGCSSHHQSDSMEGAEKLLFGPKWNYRVERRRHTVCTFYYLQGSLADLGLDQLREAPILPVPPQEWSFLAPWRAAPKRPCMLRRRRLLHRSAGILHGRDISPAGFARPGRSPSPGASRLTGSTPPQCSET